MNTFKIYDSGDIRPPSELTVILAPNLITAKPKTNEYCQDTPK